MGNATQHVFADLQQVLVELEGLVKGTAASAKDRAKDVKGELEERLARTRAHLSELGETLGHDLKQNARLADRYVRKNAWLSIGATALVAFLAGVLLTRRD